MIAPDLFMLFQIAVEQSSLSLRCAPQLRTISVLMGQRPALQKWRSKLADVFALAVEFKRPTAYTSDDTGKIVHAEWLGDISSVIQGSTYSFFTAFEAILWQQKKPKKGLVVW
ncbi:hypothetical protein PMIN05_006134 [Paraphaeosphaeria minitans]